MNDSTSSPTPSETPTRVSPLRNEFAFWCYAWLGAGFAGGALGFSITNVGDRFGGFFGGFGGTFIAGFPVFLTIAVGTWALWLSRLRTIFAAIAGAMAVVASIRFLELPAQNLKDIWMFGRMSGIDIAALLAGALGSLLFCDLFRRGYLPGRRKNDVAKTRWQFTLRELFAHFTILAVLISLWTWLFTYCRGVEKQVPQECRTRTHL